MQATRNNKIIKAVTWTLIVLIGSLFYYSGVVKLVSLSDSSSATFENFSHYGLENDILLIGLGEIISAILFIIPLTSFTGVLLLSGLIGGAIATHMGHNENYTFQAALLAMVWTTQFLRTPQLFLPSYKPATV